jgi:5-formyltetrahydrofolate cyclo-ligase
MLDVGRMPDLRQQKSELRRAMENLRADAFAKNPNAALALRDNFFKHVDLPPGGVVAGYRARGSEMDPAPLMQALHAKGYALALPAVTGKNVPLVFRIYKPGDALIPGVMGILEPAASTPVADPDIYLVPFLAFDRQRNRLGYGGGYYDRTLAAARQRKPILAVGTGFACQEIALVPTGSADVRLDKIVTEIKGF